MRASCVPGLACIWGMEGRIDDRLSTLATPSAPTHGRLGFAPGLPRRRLRCRRCFWGGPVNPPRSRSRSRPRARARVRGRGPYRPRSAPVECAPGGALTPAGALVEGLPAPSEAPEAHPALCPCDACVLGSQGCEVCHKPTPFRVCVRCSLDRLHNQLEVEGYYTQRREAAYRRLQAAGIVNSGVSSGSEQHNNS